MSRSLTPAKSSILATMCSGVGTYGTSRIGGLPAKLYAALRPSSAGSGTNFTVEWPSVLCFIEKEVLFELFPQALLHHLRIQTLRGFHDHADKGAHRGLLAGAEVHQRRWVLRDQFIDGRVDRARVAGLDEVERLGDLLGG